VGHYNSTAEYIGSAVARSLSKLGTYYIDILLLHRHDMLMDADEVASVFRTIHSQSKVRYFGVSNFPISTFRLLQSRLPFKLVTNQVEISPAHLTLINDGTLDYCQELRVRPMAWSVLRGLLEPDASLERIGSALDRQQRGRIFLALTAIAERHRVTPDVVAYAFVLKHPSRPIPILGSCKPHRIAPAIEALRLHISPEEWYTVWVASMGHNVP